MEETTTVRRILRINIDSADDAVQDPHELSRILKGLSNRIAIHLDDDFAISVYDSNGVRVGTAEYRTTVEDTEKNTMITYADFKAYKRGSHMSALLKARTARKAGLLGVAAEYLHRAAIIRYGITA